MKTLKEIYSEIGVSRRAIQGYENAGLVRATAKNKYGHLLYDQSARDRIERIKLFQDLGFTIKEISELIDAPKVILKPRLEKQVQLITNEIEQKKCILQRAKLLIEETER